MIALDRVSKAYAIPGGRKVVLDDTTLDFASGHNFGILGANGSGKSTLIRLLAGSEMPDRGRIRRGARVSFPLGFGGTFHDALSGRENVAFVARVYGAAVQPTIRFVGDFAELGHYLDMPVHTYSAGMRARLAFGTCLAIDFDVYLIDEVTEIGDERFRQRCAAAFRERLRRSDIILATHNAHTIRQYCDRAAILSGGRLQLFDDIASAFAQYRRLLGDPAHSESALGAPALADAVAA
jgi:capsular polysaccharide transport system ATP-binding protein